MTFQYLLLPTYILLFFMVPLPHFLYNSLSAELQLVSSRLGVGFIRLFSIPVFLEGNVIDLGNYKLQVVEACSGLRYLFPLTALGFIAAVIFKVALWKKVVLFLSTIPITVLMNSFRIGVIGVLVEYDRATLPLTGYRSRKAGRDSFRFDAKIERKPGIDSLKLL